MPCHKSPPIRTSYWFSISGDPGLIHCYKKQFGRKPVPQRVIWLLRESEVRWSRGAWAGWRVGYSSHPIPWGCPPAVLPGTQRHHLQRRNHKGCPTISVLGTTECNARVSQCLWPWTCSARCGSTMKPNPATYSSEPQVLSEHPSPAQFGKWGRPWAGSWRSWLLGTKGSANHPLFFLCWCFVCSVCVWKSP